MNISRLESDLWNDLVDLGQVVYAFGAATYSLLAFQLYSTFWHAISGPDRGWCSRGYRNIAMAIAVLGLVTSTFIDKTTSPVLINLFDLFVFLVLAEGFRIWRHVSQLALQVHWYLVWIYARWILGIIQLPVHLALLLPRFDVRIGRALLTSTAIFFTRAPSNTDTASNDGTLGTCEDGLVIWNKALHLCHYALATWMILQAIVYSRLVRNPHWVAPLCESKANTERICLSNQPGQSEQNVIHELVLIERQSLLVLLLVLIIRIVLVLDRGTAVTIAS